MRALRAARKGWSAETDRHYHDAAFSQTAFDPFTFAYPGYVTIRRMADLATPCLQGASAVLDAGCGPGEITCLLAECHPQISFLGIDHSEAAIARASEMARRRGLANIRFQAGAIESYTPERMFDLILLFDSFHHLTDPGAFVRRFGDFSRRFFLIEPRGDWKGTWRKDIDMDWLLVEMNKITCRIENLLQQSRSDSPQAAPSFLNPDDAVENRYSLEDFERFFTGFGIRIEGTTCGLEAYPPDPFARSPVREYMGKAAYELLTATDAWLKERNLDLLAKHWVIYAERDLKVERRALPPSLDKQPPSMPLQGPYDTEYHVCDVPTAAVVSKEFSALVRVANKSWRTWSSEEQPGPVFLSYHWLDRSGAVKVPDGKRTPLPSPLRPGEAREVLAKVVAPDQAGKYILALDLVQEGVTWFSEAGVPWLRIPIRITAK